MNIIHEIINLISLINDDITIENKIKSFLEFLNTEIKYGYIDKNNKVYNINELESEEWLKNYELQIKDRLLKTKIGHCWDFIELERWFFNKLNIKSETYFVCNSELTVTHTLLIYLLNNKVYYIESAWFKNKGIYEFKSVKEFWNYFIPLYSKFNNVKLLEYHEYKEPSYAMDQYDFIGHCIGTKF